MNDFFRKFTGFMSGRYGIDRFNKFIFNLAVAMLVISFFGIHILSKISLALFIIYVFRMLSKNYNQRYQENQMYLKYSESFRFYYSKLKQNISYRKTHKIFKCSKCGKKLSVPRKKGKIEISCPCGNKFTKKT